MNNKKILVVGAHGLLGQWIISKKPDNVFVFGIDIHAASLIHGDKYRYYCQDFTSRKEVKTLIKEINPDYIINTAAYTNVDGCEIDKEQCWKINVEGLESLIIAAKTVESKVVHISTDYIFNNDNEIISEEHLGSPLSYYGKSKLAAENALIASGLHSTILRTSTLYDLDLLKGKPNFVTWVLDNLQVGKNIKIVTDQFGNPTLARNLSDAVWNIINQNSNGIYNASGNEIIERYKFALNIAAVFNLDKDLILPITTPQLNQKAVRPGKIGFDVSKIQNEIGIKMYDVIEGLTIFRKDYLTYHRNN